MPATRITISVFGEDVVNRTLLRFGDRARDFRSVFRRIVDERLKPAARAQFATQGSFGSGGWKPIAPATRAAKERAGLDPRILHATHALRDSFQGGGDNIEEIGRDELRWGSRVEYGKYHRETRPPIQLPRTVRVMIVKDLQRHIVEGDRR